MAVAVDPDVGLGAADVPLLRSGRVDRSPFRERVIRSGGTFRRHGW